MSCCSQCVCAKLRDEFRQAKLCAKQCEPITLYCFHGVTAWVTSRNGILTFTITDLQSKREISLILIVPYCICLLHNVTNLVWHNVTLDYSLYQTRQRLQ